MEVDAPDKIEKIRALNDRLRMMFTGGKVMLTASVAELDEETKALILTAIRGFTSFNEGADPHGEHDMVFVEVRGKRYMAKVDYYDKTMQFGSADPADPAVTTRVLTIMHAGDC